ncbi:MAG: hypothetical protein H0A76_02075 [Candidatus Thiodubiliella endoseptemdiera]|uniref:Uncharacterized protein n=1 Tax=Candidatus Thiodubiliella endoseptemdiera TaxID=2738886 RepID=A0A853F039_9GAMM|nr:hypothetical protein [Candidatus Thiodubiliella endoseptemdiera]
MIIFKRGVPSFSPHRKSGRHRRQYRLGLVRQHSHINAIKVATSVLLHKAGLE